jgi:hypothetical protein
VTQNFSVTPNALSRDPGAWLHVVVAIDTTQATNVDRVKIYFNGELQSHASTNYPSLNFNAITNPTTEWRIGYSTGGGSNYLDGYLSEFVFIDGTALTPTSFAEADEDSGIWKPIDVSGLTFGTNGFYLDFENSGSLGADQSGNGNNFTPTNLASTDQMPDTPTNNFATLNILDPSALTYSEGNLKTLNTTILNYNADPTYTDVFFDMYAEGYVVSVGGASFHHRLTLAIDGVSNVQYRADGEIFIGGTLATTVASYTTGDIISAYVSLDKQNNSDGNGYGDFYYAPPSGYLALCTKNLATELTPTIDDGSQYFNTVLYTGTGSDLSITGVGFQPDWVWTKVEVTLKLIDYLIVQEGY